MSTLNNKVAVVTGAGSGIGRALALALAQRGARLALSDIDEECLSRTVDAVKGLGAQAHGTRLDVSDRQEWERYAADVADHYGVVHQIYNNAGVAGPSTSVLETDPAAYDRVLAVNLFGVINGTRAFLPHLLASGDGHVVNISSINGCMAQPDISAYCASKFAVRGFTEALRAEMISAGHPVRVTVVHPGGVKTGIATAALGEAAKNGAEPPADLQERVRVYNERLLTMPADEAAAIILGAVERGRPRVLVGGDAKALDLLVRLLPSHYPRLAAWMDRRFFGDRRPTVTDEHPIGKASPCPEH